ncbi:MAG: TIR domain-containing protein [Ilumatobacter sp.]|nr:TIR domain-containing protein [Ilumatobacter sp.]
MSLFVSYRRDDSSSASGRLVDHLRGHGFGSDGDDQIFMDIDDIPPGADYRQVIDETLARSDVVLVVIGRSWLTVTDSQGRRRLDSVSDTHRLEVAAALRSDAHVVPVLVEDAEPPHADGLPDDIADLAFRNAFSVRNQTFAGDVARLAPSLQQIGAEVRAGRERAELEAREQEARANAVRVKRDRQEREQEAERVRAQQREEAEAEARIRKEDAEADYYQTLTEKESAPAQRLPDRWPTRIRTVTAWILVAIAALLLLISVIGVFTYDLDSPDNSISSRTELFVAFLFTTVLFAGIPAALAVWIFPRTWRRGNEEPVDPSSAPGRTWEPPAFQ